jgi:hypothetical protein
MQHASRFAQFVRRMATAAPPTMQHASGSQQFIDRSTLNANGAGLLVTVPTAHTFCQEIPSTTTTATSPTGA